MNIRVVAFRARGHLPDSAQAPQRGPRSRASLVELKTAFGMTHAEAIGIEAGEEYFLRPDMAGRRARSIGRRVPRLRRLIAMKQAAVFLRLLAHAGRHPASARRVAASLASCSPCASTSRGAFMIGGWPHHQESPRERSTPESARRPGNVQSRRALAFGSWTLLHPSCSQRSRAVEAFVPTNVGTRRPLTSRFPAPRTGIGRSSGSDQRLSHRS